jgi:hypothetical protein
MAVNRVRSEAGVYPSISDVWRAVQFCVEGGVVLCADVESGRDEREDDQMQLF